MPVYVSPGVYTTILDLSLYVPNLSTTIAGAVGMASKGPLNEPVYVSNVLSFVTNFGQPSPNYMGPYAALQFLRYGRQLYYVRVAGASASAASVDMLEATTAASITSAVAGPYMVLSSDNNVLRLKVNDDSNWLVVTLTKGVRTAAQVAAEIAGAIAGGGGNQNVSVTALADGTIKLLSTTLGTGSHILIDTVANGSTANPVFGFSASGVTSDGAAATSGVITGTGVTGPYTVVDETLTFSIDGGAPITVTLPTGSQTHTAIAAAIQSTIDSEATGLATATAVTVGGNDVVRIASVATGASSSVIVTAGAGATLLGFDALLHRGTAATAGSATASLAAPYTFGSNNALHLKFNGGATRSIGLPAGLNTATAIATLINAVVGPDGYNEGVATVTSAGKLKISSLAVGASASVQCASSGSGQYALSLPTASTSGSGTPSTASVTVTARTKGTHGNALTVLASAGQTAGTFKLVVLDGEAVVEAWDNLNKDPLSTNFVETRINDNSTWITVTDDAGTSNFPAYGTAFLMTGGNDGITDITDADYIGQVTPGAKTGLQLFANAEDLDLNIVMVPGISSAAVINEMILLCATRGDCMALVDPPFGLTVQQVVDWHNGYGAYSDHQAFNSLYAALYWPWLEIYDATNKQRVWVPPSGLVAGVYAYTDYTTDTWWAPAGLNRGHLIQPIRVEHSADLGERDLLYGNQNAVNPIVNFRKDGITIWGQRSLQRKPSALDRVNVVRLVLYLRKVIATAVKYLTFEPNDPVTWATFVNLVEPYMESVKQRRGVTDYRVICDASTNPPDAMDRNEMHGVVALKPTKSAEFIEVKFAVVNQGTNFDELTY